MNDGICEDDASLAYMSIDNVVEVSVALGRGTFMGKCDIKDA